MPLSATSEACRAPGHVVGTLLAVACLALTACPNQSEERAVSIITQAKEATGGSAWDGIAIWHEIGQLTTPEGTVSQYEHWGDFRTLGVRNISPGATYHMIFDGHVAYASANAAFNPRTQLDAQMVRFGSYLGTYGFFFPERFPAVFRFGGTKVEGDASYDVVTVLPRDLPSFDVWVDKRSHHVARLMYGEHSGPVFSDFRKVNGVTIPFLTVDNGSTIRANSVNFEPEGSVRFELPKTPDADANSNK